jgi:hypothetical protein
MSKCPLHVSDFSENFNRVDNDYSTRTNINFYKKKSTLEFLLHSDRLTGGEHDGAPLQKVFLPTR